MANKTDRSVDSTLAAEYALFRDWSALLRSWYDRGGADSAEKQDELLRGVLNLLPAVIAALGPGNPYSQALSDACESAPFPSDGNSATFGVRPVQLWLRRTTAAILGCPADDGAAIREEFPFLESPFAPGELGSIGGYGVLSVLGRGGMGVIFEAYQKGFDHKPNRVALKTILPTMELSSAKLRFEAEKEILNRLTGYPNVVQLKYSSSEGQVPIIVMHYVFGPSLRDLMDLHDRRPFAIDLAVDLLRQIATGLVSAHGIKEPVIHRDLKPGNVFLERVERAHDAPYGWRVWVGDFGLAKSASAHPMTAFGDVIGSVDYMAPEQRKPGCVPTQKTDVYALGVIAFQMLTGKLVYEFQGNLAEGGKLELESIGASGDLVDFVLKLLELNPEIRLPAKDVLVALDKMMEANLRREYLNWNANRRRFIKAIHRGKWVLFTCSAIAFALLFAMVLLMSPLLDASKMDPTSTDTPLSNQHGDMVEPHVIKDGIRDRVPGNDRLEGRWSSEQLTSSAEVPKSRVDYPFIKTATRYYNAEQLAFFTKSEWDKITLICPGIDQPDFARFDTYMFTPTPKEYSAEHPLIVSWPDAWRAACAILLVHKAAEVEPVTAFALDTRFAKLAAPDQRPEHTADFRLFVSIIGLSPETRAELTLHAGENRRALPIFVGTAK